MSRPFMLALFVAASVLAGCAPMHGLSTLSAGLSQPTTAQDIADARDPALWGPYVALPGQLRSSARAGGTDISWRWIKPGRVLQEVWHASGQASPVKTLTLWRGEQPGRLHAETTGLGSQAWEGQVQPDGSVLFEGVDSSTASFQAMLTADDQLVLREAVIRGGALVSLAAARPADHYVRTDGLPVAAGVASAEPEVEADPDEAAEQAEGAETGADDAGRLAMQATIAQADQAVKQAEAQLAATRETLARAEAQAEQVERAQKTAAAFQTSTGPIPKGADKRGDFWTSCSYTARGHRGESLLTVVTNLIHERMWDEPFPPHSEQARAELRAYDGPNTPMRVRERFRKAIKASGLMPPHSAISLACDTYFSYKSARRDYDRWLKNNDPKQRFVVWSSLGARHIEGSMRLPTAEEAAKMQREAQAAARDLKAAQVAVEKEAQRLRLQQEIAQRARDCAAGVATACGARGTKN